MRVWFVTYNVFELRDGPYCKWTKSFKWEQNEILRFLYSACLMLHAKGRGKSEFSCKHEVRLWYTKKTGLVLIFKHSISRPSRASEDLISLLFLYRNSRDLRGYQLYKDKLSFLFCLLFPINISLSMNSVKGKKDTFQKEKKKYWNVLSSGT
jgi:hypothetical protein